MAQMTTTIHTLSDILHISFYQLSRGSRRNQGKVSLDRWGKAGSVLHQVLPSEGGYHLCLLQSYTPHTKHRPGAWSSVTDHMNKYV